MVYNCSYEQDKKNRKGDNLFKLSIELDAHKKLSGEHLFSLLEYIMLYGSIARAATQTGVSYRYAWGLLNEAEKIMKLPLVKKQVGGYAGGGASITEEAKSILREYKFLKTNIERNLEVFLKDIGHADSILKENETDNTRNHNYLLMASTIEPVETGLLDELENTFFGERGIFIRHLSAGSGKALDIARAGRVDMVLTHAPVLEKEFMEEGWGIEQYPLMNNDFLIIGPRSNPANIENGANLKEIFRQIAAAEANFISRGDNSGTHLKEMDLWDKAGIIPRGDWYHLYPGVAGNIGAIRYAREKNAYIMTDTASYTLSRSDDFFDIYLKNDELHPNEELKNIFVLTLVNPKKIPSSKMEEAIKFARWLQKEKGRKIISEFGHKTYKKALFTPV